MKPRDFFQRLVRLLASAWRLARRVLFCGAAIAIGVKSIFLLFNAEFLLFLLSAMLSFGLGWIGCFGTPYWRLGTRSRDRWFPMPDREKRRRQVEP